MGTTSTGGIFISYRRAGVRTQTYRLADELKRQYGESRLFLDVKSIDPGVRYADAIRDALNSCAVILVMIGPKWSEICDDNGQRRLENPADVLRIEVETALRSRARVIPVLVDGAVMPNPESLPEGIRELADLQAFSLTESHWDYDVSRLVDKMDSLLGRRKVEPDTAGAKRSFSGKVIASLVLVALVVLVYATDEIGDFDTALGAILFALGGLVLGILGYRDITAGKSRGRGAAIGSAIVGGLMTLVLLGELETYGGGQPAATWVESTAPQTLMQTPQPPPQQTVTHSAVGVELQRSTTTVQPQPAAPASQATAAVDLTGEWLSDEGLTYVFEQSGRQVSFAEYNPLLNAVTASGSGTVQGRTLEATYQTALGTAGVGSLHVSADGDTLSGTYTDLSTGVSMQLTLERQ